MDLTGSVQIGPFSLEIDSFNGHYWAEGSKSENLQLNDFRVKFFGLLFWGVGLKFFFGDFGNNHIFDRSFKFDSNPTNSIPTFFNWSCCFFAETEYFEQTNIFDPILTNPDLIFN